MRLLILLIISLFTMTDSHAQFARNRQVYLFGDPKSEAVVQQLALFKKAAAGIEDRNMKVGLARQADYEKYKVAPAAAFVLVLVGKDGGEKYRSDKPVAAEDLFTVIDAMPMRQSEMRRGKD